MMAWIIKANEKALRPQLIAGIFLIVSMFAPANADENRLPDLGEPMTKSASAYPNMSADSVGLSFQDSSNGSILSIHPQYTQQNGVAIGGSLATSIGDDFAAGVLVMAGDSRKEWLVNAGIDFSTQHRLVFTLGQLRQKIDFDFLSGRQKTQVTQDNAALSYQYLLGQDWLNAAEINAYISKTNSINLSDATYFTDTSSLYELWNDPRRIAGGRINGVQGQLVMTPTSRTTVKLGLGAESLTYNYLTGNDSSGHGTGSAELRQRLGWDVNLHASANAASAQSRYAIGLGKNFRDGSQLDLNVTRIQGRDSTFNDNQIQLSYTQSFGGAIPSYLTDSTAGIIAAPNTIATPNNPVPINHATASSNTNPWASSLVEQVSRRPNVLPAQVIAKVDHTASPTRLISINKTNVPVGSSIDNTTGAITSPVGTGVNAIASITLNGAAFTNTGQFSLSGSADLIINPNLITQPALGATDTYVVTMNNTTGGGTTLATVTVTHGSVRISSIVISSGQLTQTITFNALTSKLITDAPFVVSATASSGLPVSFTSNTTSKCTVSSNTVTLVAPGTCSITATQAGNAEYSAAASQTQTFSVNGITPVLTGFALSSSSVVFGAAAPTITAPSSASSGAITYTSSNTAVATVSGTTITIVGVGTTTITATQAADGDYASATATTTLTVNAATPVLTGFALSSSSVVFGAAAPTITAPSSASSGAITYASSNTAVATVSGTTITIVGVGTTTITATQAADGDYASATATTTLTVTMPSGYITSGLLIWAPITTTAAWATADSTCRTSTALGYSAGTWRQPTKDELLALYSARNTGISPAGWPPTSWLISGTLSSTPFNTGSHWAINLSTGTSFGFNDSTATARISCVHD